MAEDNFFNYYYFLLNAVFLGLYQNHFEVLSPLYLLPRMALCLQSDSIRKICVESRIAIFTDVFNINPSSK